VDERSASQQGQQTEDLRRIEAIWAVYPKKVGTLEGQVEIRHAIARHGFEVVLAGTKAIAEADSRRNGQAARGRYLPRPTDFFGGSRYLDDPSQYGPPSMAMDATALRKSIEDLAKRVAEHPGNPENGIGSLERKKAAGPEFKSMRALLIQRRQELASLEVQEVGQ
jgi:hypothetical protein